MGGCLIGFWGSSLGWGNTKSNIGVGRADGEAGRGSTVVLCKAAQESMWAVAALVCVIVFGVSWGWEWG